MNDRHQRLGFCLGIAISMASFAPTPVLDAFGRFRKEDPELSDLEMEMSISILEALMQRREPNIHKRFRNIRKQLLSGEQHGENQIFGGWIM